MIKIIITITKIYGAKKSTCISLLYINEPTIKRIDNVANIKRMLVKTVNIFLKKFIVMFTELKYINN
jgi:hypothetical protein